MSTLALRGVGKTYQSGQYAVKDFNLDIRDGEFIIFVGPSGCGKSTTLRMIAGLEEISEGELWIDGELMNYQDPQKRNLSMVFQNYALYPNMTVYGNLAFALKIRGISKKEIDRKVREVAEMLQIEGLLKRYPAALSGGQKQRVAIGSALVRNPNLFLMDEPLSNLDAKLRAQMRVELSRLHEELGATMIYVTHDQTEAMTLGTRIVVMRAGIIQQADTPERLYNHPVNKFVAGFIGSPAMNFLEAELGREKCTGEEEMALVRNEDREFLLPLSQDCREYLSGCGKRKNGMIVGIRPEDLYTETGKQKTENSRLRFSNALEVTVTVKELLGAETMLYFDMNGTQYCARVEPETDAEVGDTVKLYLDLDKVHWFDPETEAAVG